MYKMSERFGSEVAYLKDQLCEKILRSVPRKGLNILATFSLRNPLGLYHNTYECVCVICRDNYSVDYDNHQYRSQGFTTQNLIRQSYRYIPGEILM